MEIDGKDFMDWLHETRKKSWEKERRENSSPRERADGMRRKAEAAIGRPVKKIERIEDNRAAGK